MARGNGEGSIYKRKDGRWCGVVTIGTDHKTGKQKRKYFYAETRKEVARQMTELKQQLYNGKYIEPSDIKLIDWLNKWIDGRKQTLAYNTYRTYKGIIRNHIKDELGHLKLEDINTRMIQDLLNEKIVNGRIKGDGEGGLSVRTVKYIHQTINKALDQAVKEKLLTDNVCKAVELPKKQEEKKLHTWTIKQVNKFLKVAKDYKYYPLLFLALNTGMRRGELLGLQWKDIDMDKKRLEINRQLARTDKGLIFKKPKTKTSQRTIPLPDPVVNYLGSHKIKQGEKRLALGQSYNDNDLVCSNSIGNPVDPRNLYREFKRISKAANLPEIRFHDLRHTFATTYLQAGGNIKTLQEVLGHSSITMTIDTYSHVTEDMLNEASQKISTMYNLADTN